MRIRTTGGALLAGCAVLAALQAPPVARAATSAATCSSAGDSGGSSSAGAATFYTGPASSRTYDRTFQRAFATPHLPAYVPQGMATWRNWDGSGASLILIGLYRGPVAHRHPSLLAAVDPRDGRHLGSVRVRNAHLGGIAVVGGHLFAQDSARRGREEVRRYRLSALREAFDQARRTGEEPYVPQLEGVQEIHGADFMTTHDGRLWAGRYSEDDADRMYEYRIEPEGRLEPTGERSTVPPRTQGALVTDDAFVFHTSNHRRPGAIVVADRSGSADRPRVCFPSPSMGEGMAQLDGFAFTVYEGAAYRYPGAVNRVRDVHVAWIRDLEFLVD